MEGGEAAAGRLLDRGATGIVCGSDLMALGAVRAARQRGLAVPADVSVVGYDDSPLMAFTDPPLTTMRQPVAAMAVAAVRALVDEIHGHAAPHSEYFPDTGTLVRGPAARPTPPPPGAGLPADRCPRAVGRASATASRSLTQDLLDSCSAGAAHPRRMISTANPPHPPTTTGGGPRSSTRCTSAASPTPTATASATCRASGSGCRTCATSGVDALWLTPFYTSPMIDGGYDVADYRDVDPLFGDLADFDAMITDAHALGLRIIVDLVPNHTSSAHPWFTAALAAGPGSPERERYLFADGQGAHGELPPNDWE